MVGKQDFHTSLGVWYVWSYQWLLLKFLHTTHIQHQKLDYHSIKRNGSKSTLHTPNMHAIQYHNSTQCKPKIHLTIEMYVIVQYKTEYNNREDNQSCQVHVVNFWNNCHDRNKLPQNSLGVKKWIIFALREVFKCFCDWQL